jgi:hypothetical protein
VNAVEALRSAARGYALDRWDHWVAQYDELGERQGRDARRADPGRGPFYTDEELAVFPRYQLLRQIDVDLRDLSLEGVESLDAARDRLAAASESSLRTALECHAGEIPERVMRDEHALFVEFVRSCSQEDLAAAVPVRSRLGGPMSDAGEEYTRWIRALIAIDMTGRDAAATRATIVETLDSLGVEYSEYFPGFLSLHPASAGDFDPVRELLEELLEDASLDALAEGRPPNGAHVVYVGPYRGIIRP